MPRIFSSSHLLTTLDFSGTKKSYGRLLRHENISSICPLTITAQSFLRLCQRLDRHSDVSNQLPNTYGRKEAGCADGTIWFSELTPALIQLVVVEIPAPSEGVMTAYF